MLTIAKQKFFNRYLPLALAVLLIVGSVWYFSSNQAQAVGIAYDNAVFVEAPTFDPSYSFSYTVGSSSNRVLIVQLGGEGMSSQTPFGAVTYGGVTMTQIATYNYGVSHPILYYWLANPASGSNTLTINGALDYWNTDVNVASYSGVSQSAPTNFYTGAGTYTSQNLQMTLSVATANAWLTMAVNAGDVVYGGGGTGTTRRGTTTSTLSGYFDSNGPLSTGSQSLNSTQDQGGGGVIVELDPAVTYTYNYHRSVTIAHGQVGGGSENEYSFTALVCANGTMGNGNACPTVAGLNQSGGGAQVQSSLGYDIIFTADSGCTTNLSWEMEKYVAATGEMEAWVKIPSLSYTADTVIYMCYGSSSATTFQGGATGSAWDGNFKGVWHLPNGTTISAADSTGNASSPSLVGTPTPVAGQIDGAATIWRGGGFDNYINLGTDSAANITGKVISVEVWVKRNNSAAYGIIFSNSDGSNGYIFSLNNATTLTFTIEGINSLTIGNLPQDTNWHHLMITSNSTTVTAYIDGVSTTPTETSWAISSSSGSPTLGAANPSSTNNTYTLDEVRISNIARSAGWVSTEYNNQSAPSTFETFGPALVPFPVHTLIRGGHSSTVPSVKFRGGGGAGGVKFR